MLNLTLLYSVKAPLLCAPKHIDPNIFETTPCNTRANNSLMVVWLFGILTLLGFALTWIVVYKTFQKSSKIFSQVQMYYKDLVRKQIRAIMSPVRKWDGATIVKTLKVIQIFIRKRNCYLASISSTGNRSLNENKFLYWNRAYPFQF